MSDAIVGSKAVRVRALKASRIGFYRAGDKMPTGMSERLADPFIPLSIHPSLPPSTHPSIHRQAQAGGEGETYGATAFIMALPKTETHRILSYGDIIRPHPSIGLYSPSSASGREGPHI